MGQVTSYVKAYSASGLTVAQNASVESNWIKGSHSRFVGIGLKVTGTAPAVEVYVKTRTKAGVETEYPATANVLATTASDAAWVTKTAYNERKFDTALTAVLPSGELRPAHEYMFKFKNLSANNMTALEARLIRT